MDILSKSNEPLSHKTTILFSESQFRSLRRIAKEKGRSVGELIRLACEKQYSLEPDSDAVKAVDALSSLSLPVSSVAEMKTEQDYYKEFES